jgi:hypothetical protein
MDEQQSKGLVHCSLFLGYQPLMAVSYFLPGLGVHPHVPSTSGHD